MFTFVRTTDRPAAVPALEAGLPWKCAAASLRAARMKTSRAQLDRLLDPDDASVTLGTLARAVGRHLRMELV